MHGSDIYELVRQHLHNQGIRFTSGRQAVIRSLQRAKGPRSAAEIHYWLEGKVPLSSLYRSLAVLDEAGVLRKHHDADGLARFELAEWLTGHHHHVVCMECGVVEDVELADDSEDALSGLAERVASTVGYAVSGHVLEVEGVCGDCLV